MACRKFYSLIEFYRVTLNWQSRHSAPAAVGRATLAHAVEDELRKLGSDLVDGCAFFTMPARCCIAHAEDGQSGHARVEIGAKLSLRHTFPDDVLEDTFETARPPADTAAAFTGQMLTLVEEYLDEVRPPSKRRQVRLYQ